MSRQHSLRSHLSRKSPAPPEAAPQQSSKVPAKASKDKAPMASDGVASKENKGRSGQEEASASSQQANVGGQGISLSKMPQSPFEQWRAGGDSTHRDHPKVNAYVSLVVIMHTWCCSLHKA